MAEALTWQITGRTASAAVPDDWHPRLVQHLGQRPRRLGRHTELALFGALEALAMAGERTLPTDTVVRVCSLRGPVTAISQVLEQATTDLPMPFSFLQSQPSQMLAALAAALNWQGDASFVLAREPLALIRLALRQAGPRGVLLGWVEEDTPGFSQWLRLAPCTVPARRFAPVTHFEQLFAAQSGWLQLNPEGIVFA